MRGRRPRRGAPKHGALWSIIYIDLMTQIMAFFIILWAVEQRQEAVKPVSVGHGIGIGNQTVRMVNLPGDVLFDSGKTELAAKGAEAIAQLFGDPASGVLNFDQGGLAQRKLVIHGHTDEVGDKDENFLLGYQRAWSVYREMRKYGGELTDHVIICTHADNTPAELVPVPAGSTTGELVLTDAERVAIRAARTRNRRITIEDLVIGNEPEPEPTPVPAAEPAP